MGKAFCILQVWLSPRIRNSLVGYDIQLEVRTHPTFRCHIPLRPLTLTAINTEQSPPLWNNKACIRKVLWQCNGNRILPEQFQNCRIVLLKALHTLVMVTAFLLHGLHLFCPTSSFTFLMLSAKPVQTSDSEKMNYWDQSSVQEKFQTGA